VTTSDPILTEVNAPSIGAGQSYSANIPVTIPSSRPIGTNYIWAIADVYNVANQSNTGNDRGVTAFTVVGGQSDLIVQSISVSPTSGVAGSGATVSVTIYNQGAGTAGSSTTRLRINTSSSNVTTSDPIIAEMNAPSISAGQSYSTSIPVTIPSNRPIGANYIWAIADVYNVANQSNTGNDRGVTAFTVQGGQSDLIVQSISVSPTSTARGSGVTVSVTLYNQGSGTAGSSTTRLRINTSSSNVTTSDPILAEVNAPSIDAGQSYSTSIPVTILSNRPVGTNYIWAIADVYNVANQSNTGNDRGVTAINVF
jgi:hypothetical protein